MGVKSQHVGSENTRKGDCFDPKEQEVQISDPMLKSPASPSLCLWAWDIWTHPTWFFEMSTLVDQNFLLSHPSSSSIENQPSAFHPTTSCVDICQGYRLWPIIIQGRYTNILKCTLVLETNASGEYRGETMALTVSRAKPSVWGVL